MLHFSSDSTTHAAPWLFTAPGAATNQNSIYAALYLYVFTSPITMAVAWPALVRDTGWLPASPQLKPLYLRLLFYHGAPQGLSVRLPRFRCAHPGFFPHDKSPAKRRRRIKQSPHASLNSQTLVGLSETIWEWLAAAAAVWVRALCTSNPSIHSTSRDTIKNPWPDAELIRRTLWAFCFNHSPQATVGRSVKSD